MVERGVYRLLVNMGDLRNHFPPEKMSDLIRSPLKYIIAFQQALKQFTLEEHTNPELRDEKSEFHIGFTGSFGDHHFSPRGLRSHLLGHMVCLEGIVTKMSIVRPKLVTSMQYCPKTNKHSKRSYRDATSLDGMPTPSAPPKVDADNNPLEMDFGHCVFKDYQSVTIQEMPERAPLGQLPRSTDVLLNYDLVDTCKPGDRVQIAGVFRAMSRGGSQYSSALIANSVQTIGKEVQGLVITPNDLRNIKELGKGTNVFEIISKSLAPSIYGHEYIKKAMLLMLLGGVEKNLANGTHLRGDINILMVGDPSTAKSQMLRFVLGIAPLAVSTTGRGSTGVGLTAAVTSDPDTGERRLEAGAMVLADRGVVCIDEFDKMGDNDRVAIHEVMEQQTVTIAKAGIHASLNARCSVVAAANPVYGQYDKDSSPQKNVNLPDSLLSRFDLLFIVLDNLNPENDRAISSHILRLHRYQRPGMEGLPVSLTATSFNSLAEEDDEREDMTAPVFQKFNPLLHGGFESSNGKRNELLNTEFIRKYILYAKSRIQPSLSDDAREFVNQEYAKLRQEQEMKTLPVTARQLESFIRLSTAHAKARLSLVVEVEDSKQALKIMRYALYHDTEVRMAGVDSDDEEEVAEENTEKPKRKQAASGGDMKRKKAATLESDSEDENVNTLNQDRPEEDSSEDEYTAVDESSDRYKVVLMTVSQLFRQTRKEEITLEEITKAMLVYAKQTKTKVYSSKELVSILDRLDQRNKIMFRDGVAYKI